MAENTKIEWAHHTFNPWIGCTKVSPACDHCYAEADFSHRRKVVQWGAGQPRKHTAPSTWAQPLRWNAEAERLGVRYRVFCASLADVFDNEVPVSWRRDLFDLIADTPHLDWLLLTKRIGNARTMYADAYLDSARPWPANVWIGASITSQAEADRDITKLLAVPASKRFLSMEPLLGPVDLTRWLRVSPQIGKNLNSLVPLDDQVGQHGFKQSDCITLPGNLPHSDRLPAMPFDALVVPPDESANGVLQPFHDGGMRVVDGKSRTICAAGSATPVEIPLSIKKAGKVGDGANVVWDGDSLIMEGRSGPSGESLARNLPLNAGPAGAEPRSNRGNGLAGFVRAGDGGAPFSSLLHWVIVGGESGPNARPMHPDWARSLRDQCQAADVPFFFKQWGEWMPYDFLDPAARAATQAKDWQRAHGSDFDRGLVRVGKKAAGRLLDGREWNEVPA